MGNLFTGPPTPEEQMKQSRAALRKSIRELDRERGKLQIEEKKLDNEMKQLAKQGQIKSARIVSKNIAKTRHSIATLYETRAKLEGVRTQIRNMTTVATMQNAMKEATVAMYRMNRGLNMPQMQHLMREFEKQTMVLGMKQEMMDDAIETAEETSVDADEEAEQILAQAMDEIGVSIGTQMGNTPMTKKEDQELSNRLKKLKNED
jgi:charged multivesicular body protein 2A